MGDSAQSMNYTVHGILNYFTSGKDSDEAVKCLLVSSEKYPQLFPRVDYRDVHFWYETFKKGDFNFNQEPEYPKMTQLHNTPVLNEILKYTTATDQIVLRQVCKSLRTKIDSDERLFERISFNLSTSYVDLNVKSGTNKKWYPTRYKRKGNGCEIIKNGVVTKSDKNFIEESLIGFQNLIEKMDTKVKNFSLTHSEERVKLENRQKFVARALGVLNKLKLKLSVQNLSVTVTKSEELEGILSELQPGPLKKLKIESTMQRRIKSTEVPSLSGHLQHLKELKAMCLHFNIPMNSFLHMNDVSVCLDSVTVAETVSYKNELIQHKSFRSHFLACDMDSKKLMPALKPFTPITDPHSPTGAYFPHQDGGRIKLRLGCAIHFKKIKRFSLDFKYLIRLSQNYGESCGENFEQILSSFEQFSMKERMDFLESEMKKIPSCETFERIYQLYGPYYSETVKNSLDIELSTFVIVELHRRFMAFDD